MSQKTIRKGDLIVIPQDSGIYKIDKWESYSKVYQFDSVKEKPIIAIFISSYKDDYCEVAIGDEKVLVDFKDIYLAEGTKYVN
jgi:hypothetical protein